MERTTTNTYPDLKSWREAQGFTHKQAAEFLGMSRSHYRTIELGYTSPRAVLAQQIIEKTGVPLESLSGAA
jgi:transcriptional regulator with XRE-family HTH domain